MSRRREMRVSLRDDLTAKRISEAPASVQKSLARAFSGAASPRAAIKAHCLTCVGFNRSAVENCTGWSCPLWAYRPFQSGAAR